MSFVQDTFETREGTPGQELLNIYNCTCLNQIAATLITASGNIVGNGLVRAANTADATALTSTPSLYTDGGLRERETPT
jgi:hypothetical protein